MSRLGTYKADETCIYIRRLEDVDAAQLEALIRASVARMRQKYGRAG